MPFSIRNGRAVKVDACAPSALTRHPGPEGRRRRTQPGFNPNPNPCCPPWRHRRPAWSAPGTPVKSLPVPGRKSGWAGTAALEFPSNESRGASPRQFSAPDDGEGIPHHRLLRHRLAGRDDEHPALLHAVPSVGGPNAAVIRGDQHEPILLSVVRSGLHGGDHLTDQDIHRLDGVQIRKYKGGEAVGVPGVVRVIEVHEDGVGVAVTERPPRFGSRARFTMTSAELPTFAR